MNPTYKSVVPIPPQVKEWEAEEKIEKMKSASYIGAPCMSIPYISLAQAKAMQGATKSDQMRSDLLRRQNAHTISQLIGKIEGRANMAAQMDVERMRREHDLSAQQSARSTP